MDLFPSKCLTVMEPVCSGKKMPRRTYITQEEKALPRRKPMKERLTLLLCGNASGDFKIKPLLAYHSENLCTKYCCKSLNKQSSGVQERINPFYIHSYVENSFGLRTFQFTNDLQERIKFVNRGLTVTNFRRFQNQTKA